MVLSSRSKQTNELKVNTQFPLKKNVALKSRPSRSQPSQSHYQHTSQRTTLTSHSHHSQPANITNTNTNSIAEIVGFLPKRGDFDYEYDNDAELLLAEMEFNDDDNETEIKMKYKILDIYNARLDERIKRKQFVIERDILDYHKQSNFEKTRTKEEKEIYNLMKVFARFNVPEEHEQLLSGLISEKKIRTRIEELNAYRKQGFRTLEQVDEAAKEKAKFDEDYQNRIKQLEQYCNEQHQDSSVQSKFGSSTKRTTRVNKESNEKEEKKFIGIKEEEIELAQQIGISIQEYLLIKDIIIREAMKEQHVSREFLENQIKIGQ